MNSQIKKGHLVRRLKIPSPAIGGGYERDISAEVMYYAPKEGQRGAAMKRPCPDCPDGYVWNSSGPTAAECPNCGGKAYVEEEP